MRYIVRDMMESDVEQVASLEARLFPDGWSEDSLRSSMMQKHVKILLAVTSIDEICGYHIFYTSMDEGDVARIAVAPAYRRAGIADRLLNDMWIYSREKGISRILLEVRQSNIGAIALYEKHGFQSLGVRKGYYQNPLEDGVIMEMTLDITTSN